MCVTPHNKDLQRAWKWLCKCYKDCELDDDSKENADYLVGNVPIHQRYAPSEKMESFFCTFTCEADPWKNICGLVGSGKSKGAKDFVMKVLVRDFDNESVAFRV